MQKVSWMLFSLQGGVEQSLRLVIADVINKFADRLLAQFKRVIANDEIGGLVNRHYVPPNIRIIRSRIMSSRVFEKQSPVQLLEPSQLEIASQRTLAMTYSEQNLYSLVSARR